MCVEVLGCVRVNVVNWDSRMWSGKAYCGMYMYMSMCSYTGMCIYV